MGAVFHCTSAAWSWWAQIFNPLTRKYLLGKPTGEGDRREPSMSPTIGCATGSLSPETNTVSKLPKHSRFLPSLKRFSDAYRMPSESYVP
jgi:hypothetical protein